MKTCLTIRATLLLPLPAWLAPAGPVVSTNGLPTLDLAKLGDFTAKGLQDLKAACFRVFFAMILVLGTGCSTVGKSVNESHPTHSSAAGLSDGPATVLSVTNFVRIRKFILDQGKRQTYGNMFNHNPAWAFSDFNAYLNPPDQKNINCEIAKSEFNTLVFQVCGPGPNRYWNVVLNTTTRELCVQQRDSKTDPQVLCQEAGGLFQKALAEMDRLLSLPGCAAPASVDFRTNDLPALDLANVGKFWKDDRQVHEDSSRVRFGRETTYLGGLGYAGKNKHIGVAVFQSEADATQAMEALQKDVTSVIEPGDTHEFGGRRWWFNSGLPNGIYVVCRNTIVMAHCYQPPFQRSEGMLHEAASTVVARIEHESKYSSANDGFFNSLTNRLTQTVGGQWEVRSGLLWGTKLNRAGTAEFTFNILPHPNCGPEAVKLWEFRRFYCSAPCHVVGVSSNLVLTVLSGKRSDILNSIADILGLIPVQPCQTAEQFLADCSWQPDMRSLRLVRAHSATTDAPPRPREILMLEIPDTTMGCFKKLSKGGSFVEPLSLAFTNTSNSGEVEVRFNFLGKKDTGRQIQLNLTLFEVGGRMIFREGETHEDCRLRPDEMQRSSFVARFSPSNEAEFKVPMDTLRAAVRVRLEFVHHGRSDDGSRLLGQLKAIERDSTNAWKGWLSDLPDWECLGVATGKTKPPAGKWLGLSVTGDACGDLDRLGLRGSLPLAALVVDGENARRRLTDEGLGAVVLAYPHLRTLSLRHTDVTEAGLEFLAGLKSLQRLYLYLDQAGAAGLEHISRVQSLTDLALYAECEPTAKDFQCLARLENVENLWIAGPGLGELARLPRLRRLFVSARDVKADGLDVLAKANTLEELSLKEGGTREQLAALAKLTRLRSLYLGNTGKESLEPLAHLTELRKLGLGDVREGTSLQPLSSLTNLQELTLSGPLTDAMLTGLGPLPVLRYLSLNPHFQNMTRGLSDKTLEHVAQFALLEKLACYHDGPFSDAGLAHLARLTNLKSLVFPNCDRFTEVGIQRLSQLQSLEELELRGNGLTDAGLAHIAGLRNLGRLALHDTVAVTDAGMAALRSHPSLKRLQLYSPHIITTVGVNHLNTVTNFVELEIEEFRSLDDVPLDFSKLEHLEKLHITGCRSHDLAGLASLKRLKHLTVGNVTGEGLRHISRIAALEQLSVLNQINRLTDADLAPLADVTRLTSLTISSDFTAAGLRHLAALKGLTYLKVETTKQITADERSELQDSHPCLRYASFTTKKP